MSSRQPGMVKDCWVRPFMPGQWFHATTVDALQAGVSSQGAEDLTMSSGSTSTGS